jgi:hypothetical protein
MGAERQFLDKVSEYLLSLPFDLKILQEAVTDPDLGKGVREVAAGTIIHTLLPQDGETPGRYVDDVLWVRAALQHISQDGSEGAKAFRDRFADVYAALAEDVPLFESTLGDLWPWLTSKLESFAKLSFKGVKPSQCVEDDESATLLYEEGLEFQTNYPVDENQVRNKIRKVETIVDLLNKRRAEEAKKKT